MKKNICVIDFETTGIITNKLPRVTEIGIVKVDNNLEFLDSYQSYVNPEEKLSDFIVKFTGITDEMLETAPKFGDIAKNIVKFIDPEETMIAAWPLGYEMPILQSEFALAGWEKFPLHRRGIDIGTLATHYLIKKGISIVHPNDSKDIGPSLENVLLTLNIARVGKQHSALDDCYSELSVLKAVW